MVRKISVSEEVWAEIAKRGEFGETEDLVLRRVFGLVLEDQSASQTAESGARAAAWGRETADKIAAVLGAEKTNPRANEYRLSNEAITIRCAHVTTNSVGVTKKMLDRVDAVIAALETVDGRFELYKVKPSVYSESMRDSRSNSASASSVGIVPTSLFKNKGVLITTVDLD